MVFVLVFYAWLRVDGVAEEMLSLPVVFSIQRERNASCLELLGFWNLAVVWCFSMRR